MRWILQLISNMSRVLQKLLIYLNRTAVWTILCITKIKAASCYFYLGFIWFRIAYHTIWLINRFYKIINKHHKAQITGIIYFGIIYLSHTVKEWCILFKCYTFIFFSSASFNACLAPKPPVFSAPVIVICPFYR